MTINAEQLKEHYKTVTPEERENSAKRRSGKWPSYFNALPGLDIEVFTPVEGDNVIRILPVRADDDSQPDPGRLGIEIRKYFINNQSVLGADTFDTDRSINCPAKKAFFDAHARRDAETKSLFKSTLRELVFVEDYTNLKTGEKPKLKIFEIPQTVRDSIEKKMKDRRTGELIDVTDPVSGRLIAFYREGAGLSTKYENIEIVEGEVPVQALYELPKFSELLKVPTVEEMQQHVNNATEYTQHSRETGVVENKAEPTFGAQNAEDALDGWGESYSASKSGGEQAPQAAKAESPAPSPIEDKLDKLRKLRAEANAS